MNTLYLIWQPVINVLLSIYFNKLDPWQVIDNIVYNFKLYSTSLFTYFNLNYYLNVTVLHLGHSLGRLHWAI